MYMPLMRTNLFNSDLFSARYVSCQKAAKERSQEEFSDADVLIFPIRGAFVEHYTAKCSILADPTVALLFPSGSSSRISHPIHTEDDCFVFEFSSTCFQEALYATSGIEIWRTPAHCYLPLKDLASRSLLLYRLQRRAATSLETEETGLTLLNTVLSKVYESFLKRQKRAKVTAQIEEVKTAFLTNPEMKWNLTALGAIVKISPFHLTRLFRDATGLPLHRYLLYSRLAKAIDTLLNTDRDLTQIALDLSFSSHSHFTSVFHRMIGLTPSVFRSSANSRKVAEKSKILLSRIS